MCNDTATPQLEELVTTVANQLMTVDAATSAEVSQRVLAYLVEQLGVDVSFLRHNDRDRRATRLVAEWPPRLNIPDPDPLRLIYFADADPVFALCEHAKEPLVFRPEPATEDYQRLIEEARGVPVTSAAAVPLVSGEITTGLLGFIKFGDRKWHEAELNALMTIATLFAQVQARVAAEARLRYLADHDDLTGLHNRRALLQHLDQRLAPGQPGPVAALFLDLDRLKAINDYLGHAAGDQFIHVFAQRIGDALYWYFRKKDDLLNAMTDRALSKYVFATPYIEAGDWRETLRNHARSMRKTFADNPVLCDLILIRAALSPKTARLGAQEMEKAIANLVTAGLSLEDAFDIYSAVSVHVRGSVVLDRLSRKSQSAGSGPSAIEHPVAIDPATTPLLAHATGRGHRIGAPDETNFEYGLECILDHAGRLIEQSSKAAGEVAVRRPTATADAPTPGARAKAVAR